MINYPPPRMVIRNGKIVDPEPILGKKALILGIASSGSILAIGTTILIYSHMMEVEAEQARIAAAQSVVNTAVVISHIPSSAEISNARALEHITLETAANMPAPAAAPAPSIQAANPPAADTTSVTQASAAPVATEPIKAPTPDVKSSAPEAVSVNQETAEQLKARLDRLMQPAASEASAPRATAASVQAVVAGAASTVLPPAPAAASPESMKSPAGGRGSTVAAPAPGPNPGPNITQARFPAASSAQPSNHAPPQGLTLDQLSTEPPGTTRKSTQAQTVQAPAAVSPAPAPNRAPKGRAHQELDPIGKLTAELLEREKHQKPERPRQETLQPAPTAATAP